MDTSVTVRWLTEQGYEVHAVVVDVGQHEDFEGARERGDTAGAAEVRVVRAADRFAEEFVADATLVAQLHGSSAFHLQEFTGKIDELPVESRVGVGFYAVPLLP